jgi:hypothetical protein
MILILLKSYHQGFHILYRGVHNMGWWIWILDRGVLDVLGINHKSMVFQESSYSIMVTRKPIV